MAYTPTEWVSGTIISASKLNNIERGVESVNSEYTPTTWAEGDTVTAAKLNKIEQGIAAASGGDFSTAQVTIVNNMPNNIPIYILGSCIVNDTLNYVTNFEVGTSSASIVLYKGSSIIYPDVEETVTVSGSATIDDGQVTITGDCTITIS